ncbi:hypothetical protein ACO0SA_003445 [Hanseniaspora valbyensis]|uniref:Uncharacterized protein n=1 Tax=Hanseniaspora valbyensis NRRL Y-1626 TaxID=766949 RepID=A0A1B7TBB1_9ASCO|nr:hypothetical protein HANVADRAFT_53477 [Hanseniaspora valbyensis NRRL Y-1626]
MAGVTMVTLFGKTFPNLYIAYAGLGLISLAFLPTTPTDIKNSLFPSSKFVQQQREDKVNASLDFGKDDKETEFVKKYVAEHYKH